MKPDWTVVSDLHLFAARSRAARHLEDIVEAARESRLLVLNGDIFDFDWSSFGSVEATADAAEAWIRDLARHCPDCEIAYLLGNHDGVRQWAERLRAIAEELPNLRWSPDYYRLGNTLFTHGDLLMGPSARPGRELVETVNGRGQLVGKIYAAASHVGLSRIVSMSYGVRRCLRDVRRNLAALDENLTRGVERLCIGHTHRPFTAIEVNGVTVYNSGSSIRGMRFNMLRLSADNGATP